MKERSVRPPGGKVSWSHEKVIEKRLQGTDTNKKRKSPHCEISKIQDYQGFTPIHVGMILKEVHVQEVRRSVTLQKTYMVIVDIHYCYRLTGVLSRLP